MTEPTAQLAPSQTAAQALIQQADKAFERMSKGRYAEERQWLLAALFDQLKQWLTWDDASKRYKVIEQSKSKPVPMPVSNYFSKAISANANSLGAKIPQVTGVPHDSSAPNRRAAQMAEIASDELDRETTMEVLNPVLARQVPLFGMGVTWETVKRSYSQALPQIGLQSEVGPDGDEALSPQLQGMLALPGGTLHTELPTIFEVYVPRDCVAANLAKEVYRKRRVSKTELVSEYGEPAEKLKGDDTPDNAITSAESIRFATVSQGGAQRSQEDLVTLCEYWAEWCALSDEVQDLIEQEWGEQPSLCCQGMSKAQAAQQYGVYVIYAKGEKEPLDIGENPWQGEKPATFFPWQMDSANPYPKGLSQELIPLQKQLNRLDSLMEKAAMTNGVGKWIVPLTQNGVTQQTGDPADYMWFDPIGDGKGAPQFVAGTPYGEALTQKREQILSDFAELGLTEGVDTGDSPDGVKSFRGIAYLGAKADEARQTQRMLFEQAHQLRKRKLLIMAKKVWDEPRKAKVAGFNGKFGMTELTGADLTGDYSIEVIPGSSRPKTQDEKLQAMQTLITGLVVNPADPEVQDYLFDALNITEVKPADYLQRTKAERDLELLKQGQQPQEVPSEKWDITLQVFGNYMLTEDYEAQPPEIQAGIQAYFQYCSDKLTVIKQTLGGMNPADPTPAIAQAFGAKPQANNPLSGVPGQTTTPEQAQNAAAKEGAGVVKQVSPA